MVVGAPAYFLNGRRALNCLFRIQRAHELLQSSIVPRFLSSVEHCWKVVWRS